jgi:hypothetical protein
VSRNRCGKRKHVHCEVCGKSFWKNVANKRDVCFTCFVAETMLEEERRSNDSGKTKH